MSKYRTLGFCLVAAALASTANASAQDYQAKSRRVDSLFARYSSETPGVSIRVIEKGQVVHRGEYGMADLENHVPITSSTVFAIGSNSKQFTGMAIAMLAEEAIYMARRAGRTDPVRVLSEEG